MKILNIYGQEAWHTDARIIGNVHGLIALKKAINRALETGKATTEDDVKKDKEAILPLTVRATRSLLKCTTMIGDLPAARTASGIKKSPTRSIYSWKEPRQISERRYHELLPLE